MLCGRAVVLFAIAAFAGCASCPRAGTAGASGTSPAAIGSAASAAPTNAIPVRIDAEGRAYVRDQPMYRSEDFSKAIGSSNSGAALLSAEPGVPYGRVAAVVDELKRAGISRVDLASGSSAAASENPTAPAASASAAPVASAPSGPTPSETPAPPPADAKSLPEVKVESIGLHIGGGPNDDSSKAPYLKTVEARFDDFRSCYVKAVDPEKGGTFGVDLHISRNGGRAKIEQPRTGMKGTEFRQCVIKVFESLEFGKPARGPTTVSYSLRYTLLK